MFKGFWFLLKFTWKFSRAYVFYIFSLQIVLAATPLLSVVLPRFIIDELLGYQRVNMLLMLIW